ncbi:MAG: hypothetical protein ACR2LX_09140 [Jatrophihabitans sp.]
MPQHDVATFLPPMDSTTVDFDFLQGWFDVTSRRLRDPLDHTSGWVVTQATSSARTHFGGAVSIDEMSFPANGNYGMSLRLFDPAQRAWSIYWVDSRTGRLQPPVIGRSRRWLTGPDEYAEHPVIASYSWTDVTDHAARWQQCFSLDEGATWLPNWTMDFVRRASEPDHTAPSRVISDFDFLVGRWHVQHRRLLDPLGAGCHWVDFTGVMTARSYFDGAVSVDEDSLSEPGQRGLTFGTYDRAAREWAIYWVNSRVGRLQPPVRGAFVDGVGTFVGTEHIDGRNVLVRFVWSEISTGSARWRQAFSVDAGTNWTENWEMRFTRAASA